MALKYAVLTFSGEGLPIAYKLACEGNEVICGVIEDNKDILVPSEHYKPEDPEDKKRRMSAYDGMLDKMSAKELVAKLLKEKNPEEWFIFTDFNHCFKYAEQLKGKGFNGNFPTQKDREMEVDRDEAKKIVEKEYPDLKVAEVEEFSKCQEGIDFLQDTDSCWVLKGKDEDAKTVVPDTKDPDLAAHQIIEALEGENSSNYEKSGYILEKMIDNVIELTPEIQFYNGKPIAYLVDIELKRLGAGDNSVMTGCSADLVFTTNAGDKINELAFPPFVYDMAKKHEGLFVWDASLLFDKKTGEAYFGEYCPNRMGYNCFYTELSLLDRVSDYFEAVVKGENPFKEKYGEFASSVRMFNMHKDKDKMVLGDAGVEYSEDIEPQIWLMDVKYDEEKDKCVTCGYSFDLGVATGKGNDIRESAKSAYQAVDELSFMGKYFRPLSDYIDTKYPTSLINRYNWGKKEGLY